VLLEARLVEQLVVWTADDSSLSCGDC